MDLSTLSGEELKLELDKAMNEEVLNNNLQMGMKILLNAGFGVLGNEHFLYFKVENAEAITLTGQLVNRWTGTRVNKFLKDQLDPDHDYHIYSDTDSLFLSLKPLHDVALKDKPLQEKIDLIDKFEKQTIKPFIESQMEDLADYLNSVENKMVWERENIAESMVGVSKKRYAMKVWDNEGLRYKDDPYYKIMGLDSIRSSTPEWSRDFLKECYIIALDYDQVGLHDKVKQVRKEFNSLSINDIAVPRGISDIDKWADPVTLYGKGTPKHVKAALVFNKLIKEHRVQMDPITPGNKIKFIDLKVPNPTGESVVAFHSYLPSEFGLEEFVDRDSIFESAFLKPLQGFLDAIGWSWEPVISLESFFG